MVIWVCGGSLDDFDEPLSDVSPESLQLFAGVSGEAKTPLGALKTSRNSSCFDHGSSTWPFSLPYSSMLFNFFWDGRRRTRREEVRRLSLLPGLRPHCYSISIPWNIGGAGWAWIPA